MKISGLLTKDTMLLDLNASTKKGVIDELVQKLSRAGKLNDVEKYKEAIHQREQESSTGIGEGVAIPHAKTEAVKAPAIAFGRAKAGVDYDSLDGQPSHLFFMIAASDGADNEHLETLSRLSTFLMDQSFREMLLNAGTDDEILNAINKKEQEESEDNQPEAEQTKQSGKILAVTGCPTGIAHTYMAADALKQKAEEMGYEIKVQKNGSAGVKDALTEAEIQEAVAIIIAADTKVDTEPFIGKRVVQAPVTDGIRHPDSLIEKAVSGEAPVFQGEKKNYEDQIKEKRTEQKNKQPAFYKHLMNGVSHMLPFVVGGGILLAISFMFGIHAADPTHESYNRLAEAFSLIGGGSALGLMIPIFAGFIAYSIADRPGLAPGVVGGWMAANGDAGFLGGLIAGFLAGYIIVGLKKLFSGLPDQLEGLKPVLFYPLFGIGITGLIMFFFVSEPVGAFNNILENWLSNMGTTNLILLGLIVGGMMAVDMGGPINKAAYTTGVALLSSDIYAPMAAIMAGGMVPPLGLALATTFFKKKFTSQEREAGKTAYVMGASFITEGAIPFAAVDPFRVIPAAVAGSATAGALAMAFGCTLRAPHGGVFVIPFVENPVFYIISIIIGSAVTAVIIGFWKKPAN